MIVSGSIAAAVRPVTWAGGRNRAPILVGGVNFLMIASRKNAGLHPTGCRLPPVSLTMSWIWAGFPSDMGDSGGPFVAMSDVAANSVDSKLDNRGDV